jgi:hypothetical protein
MMYSMQPACGDSAPAGMFVDRTVGVEEYGLPLREGAPADSPAA